jgi:hypothetical protein
VFRRRNAGADGEAGTATTDEAAPGTTENSASRAVTPGKGRPTPKRSESERRRRYAAPGDKKATSTQSKDRDRAERGRKYEAMKRGEDWALPVRDKGPVRALTRDYVDSHRKISEYYMYLAFALLIVLLIPDKSIKTWIYPIVLALVAVMVVEGYATARAVRKLAAERHPGESTRGITMYAIMRTLQIRRLRMPTPRTKPGDKL